jgi:hypothetical protein
MRLPAPVAAKLGGGLLVEEWITTMKAEILPAKSPVQLWLESRQEVESPGSVAKGHRFRPVTAGVIAESLPECAQLLPAPTAMMWSTDQALNAENCAAPPSDRGEFVVMGRSAGRQTTDLANTGRTAQIQ